ncbi:MAG: site-2 protease family protein [Marinilabiliales bacterium]|nr:site-2 protease family protein [Marinilabiliales bacterium]
MLKGKGMIDATVRLFTLWMIKTVGKESPAKTAGIIPGDQITGIDSVSFTFSDEFSEYLSDNRSKPIILNIDRKGVMEKVTVIPDSAGLLGISYTVKALDQVFELKTLEYGFLASFPAGIDKGFKTIADYLKQFKLIFSKDTKAYESLGGFITIGSIFPGVWDWQAFWNLTAFLSIILAVMNILPIPALDGGHVMFLLFEVVTGRKPSDKFLEYAQIAGMVILLSLLIFANGNDILKLLRK